MKKPFPAILAVCLLGVALSTSNASGAIFDWRDIDGMDFTTPVKNQGACGSCWAFGAVAALESKFEINLNDPWLDLDLSEQHLLSEGSSGSCRGGYEFRAMEYYRDFGIADEATVPYRASDDSPDYPISGPHWLYQTDELDTWLNAGYDGGTERFSASNIKAALEQEGLLPTFIDAWTDFYNPFTGQRMYAGQRGYHCVAIAGYDEDTYGRDYFIVKNSWGSGWGPTLDGYGYVPFEIVEGWGRTHAITGDTFRVWSAVPEPASIASWSLLLIGIFGCAARRHRKRAA